MESTLENPSMGPMALPPPPPAPPPVPKEPPPPEVAPEAPLGTETAPPEPKEAQPVTALSAPAEPVPQDGAPVGQDAEAPLATSGTSAQDPAPQGTVPQDAPKPVDAAQGTSERAFNQWSWGTASQPPAVDPKAITLSACTGVGYDYVAADLETAAKSADDLVVARCFKVLPVTAGLFSDPALDPALVVNLPGLAKAELAVGALAAGQKDVYFVRQNAAQTTLALGMVGGFSLAGPAVPNTDQAVVTISDHSTQLQAALPQDGTGRGVVAAFQPSQDPASESAQNSRGQPPQPVLRDQYPLIENMGGPFGIDIEQGITPYLGPSFLNALEDALGQELPKHNANNAEELRAGTRQAIADVLRNDLHAVSKLVGYPDHIVSETAQTVIAINDHQVRAQAVVDSLQALLAQHQRTPLSPEFLNQAAPKNGLQMLFLSKEALSKAVDQGALPAEVMNLLAGEGFDGHLALPQVLDLAGSLTPEQQKAFFSILQASDQLPSLATVEAWQQSPGFQDLHNTLADAILVSSDDYAYSAQHHLLNEIGGDELIEQQQYFLFYGPESERQAGPQTFSDGSTPLISKRGQSIAFTQTLDLFVRAHDRDLKPGELSVRESHGSSQSKGIEALFPTDGSPLTVGITAEAYVNYLAEELRDSDLTEEARARLEGSKQGLLTLFGLPPDTDLKAALATLTPEQWARFADGYAAFSMAKGEEELPGQKAFVDMARWLFLRTPDGARLFAEQDTLYFKAKEKLQEWEGKYQLSTRSLALLGLIGAIAQGGMSVSGLAAGGAATGTGLGALPGAALISVSFVGLMSALDMGDAALRQLITGDPQGTFTEALIEQAAAKAGISPEVVALLEVGLGLVSVSNFGPKAARYIFGMAQKGGQKLAQAGAAFERKLVAAVQSDGAIGNALDGTLDLFSIGGNRMALATDVGSYRAAMRSDASGGRILENRAHYNRGSGGGGRGATKPPVRITASAAAKDGFHAIDHINPSNVHVSALGERLGSGGEKTVYELKQEVHIVDDETELGAQYAEGPGVEPFVLGVLKEGKPLTKLVDELKYLDQLRGAGLPVVGARGPFPVHLGGGKRGQAILYERFKLGSKEVVRTKDGIVTLVGHSPYLNEISIQDLEKIRDILMSQNIRVKDLQFLIGKDGRVVIADPLEVFMKTPPTNTNLATIDLLIEEAKRNTGSKG